MFRLIQRGQIFADRQGWPVIIHSVRGNAVRYWRNGRVNTASMDRFNIDFEALTGEEAAQIRAELSQSDTLRNCAPSGPMSM